MKFYPDPSNNSILRVDFPSNEGKFVIDPDFIPAFIEWLREDDGYPYGVCPVCSAWGNGDGTVSLAELYSDETQDYTVTKILRAIKKYLKGN